jgi:hypothetical protein
MGKRRTVASMEQLTALDAGFLQAEDSDRYVSLAIGALAVARLTALSAGHWRSTPVGTLALVQGG